MTRIILTVENKKQSDLLSNLFHAVTFIKKIEEEEYDETLEEEVKQLLDRRWNDYKKNPQIFISDKELRKRISKKYGVRN